MIVVHFINNKNIELLNQLLGNTPSEGESVVIKGRKGTVISVTPINDKHVNVLVELEEIKKAKSLAIDPKKKRR